MTSWRTPSCSSGECQATASQDAWPSQSENDQVADSGVWEDVASVVVPAAAPRSTRPSCRRQPRPCPPATEEPRLFGQRQHNSHTVPADLPRWATWSSSASRRATRSAPATNRWVTKIDISEVLELRTPARAGSRWSSRASARSPWETGQVAWPAPHLFTREVEVTAYDAQGAVVEPTSTTSACWGRGPAGATNPLGEHRARLHLRLTHPQRGQAAYPGDRDAHFRFTVRMGVSTCACSTGHFLAGAEAWVALAHRSAASSRVDNKLRPSTCRPIMALSDVASSESGDVWRHGRLPPKLLHGATETCGAAARCRSTATGRPKPTQPTPGQSCCSCGADRLPRHRLPLGVDAVHRCEQRAAAQLRRRQQLLKRSGSHPDGKPLHHLPERYRGVLPQRGRLQRDGPRGVCRDRDPLRRRGAQVDVQRGRQRVRLRGRRAIDLHSGSFDVGITGNGSLGSTWRSRCSPHPSTRTSSSGETPTP